MNQRGASLVESLLVVVVLGSIVVLIANIPNALMLINKSRHLSLAREIAAKQIEDKRTIDYIDIGLGETPIDDPRLSFLPQSTGMIEVGVKDTSTPDPDDWIPCDVSVCTNGEEAKLITVTINWMENKLQTITLKTMIGEGGINQSEIAN